jgi:hypothetical protein
MGYVGKFEFDVEAPEIISEDDNGGSEDDNSVISANDGNSLPYLPFSVSMICVIFAAFVRR